MDSLFINDDLPHHMAVLGHLSQPTTQDPYRYQHGFNNHHASEAFTGALPRAGTNIPQKHPYGLYAEHLNGTAFISSRESVSNVYVTCCCFLHALIAPLQPYASLLTWMGHIDGCTESDLLPHIDRCDHARLTMRYDSCPALPFFFVSPETTSLSKHLPIHHAHH